MDSPEPPSPELPARSPGFFRALLGNLAAGFRLLSWRLVSRASFTIHFDQLAVLLAIDIALLIGLDWLLADDGATFDSYGFYAWACYFVAILGTCALIARSRRAEAADTRALLLVFLAAAPALIIVLALVLLLPLDIEGLGAVTICTAIVLLILGQRAVILVFGHASIVSSILVTMAVIGVPWSFQHELELDPALWYVADTAADATGTTTGDAGDAESILFEQPAQIANAIAKTDIQRPGVVDTFFVGFAGDGSQRVFRNEAQFAAEVFAKKFGTGPRTVELINDERDRDTYPLATASGLRNALQLIGARMDKQEDVLVLFLTSHGSHESGIAVRNGGLPLVDLEPEDVRSALDDAQIKWRVVVVSACYAGIFIEPLKSADTLVITAADADHTSFGCADDRDLTYFGEAFLRDALPEAPSIEAAFQTARRLIATRERAEKLTPSNPEISVGQAIRQKLAMPE